MTDWLNLILGSVGSIISIIGFLMSLRKDRSSRNKVLYGLIILLTISMTIISFKYKRLNDELLSVELRKVNVKTEASRLLYNNPSFIDYYDPGSSEGVLYSTLTLLEANKDIYPETYELYKENVINKMEKANNEPDIYKRREQMEIAGNSALQLLKALAK